MVKARRMPEYGTISRRYSDLIGLGLFFLGAACLLALTWPQQAPVPDGVTAALRLLAGSGAFVVPLIFLFAGSMFLLGYERLTFSHSSYGCLLLFFAYVTWRHLTAANGLASGDLSDEQAIKHAGGYLGAVFGTIFLKLLGSNWSYLLLTMMVCMAVVLLVEKPFLEILHFLFQRPAQAGLAVAKQGVTSVREKSGAVRELKAARALAPAPDVDESAGKRRGFLVLRREPVSEEDPDPPVEAVVPAANPPRAGAGVRRKGSTGADPNAMATLDLDIGGEDAFKLPPLSLLSESPPVPKKAQGEVAEKTRVLEQTLEDFNIQANVMEVAAGPTITRYEIQLAPGIKVSKIVSLADNLAMALAAIDVRVEAPIPGKSAIGVEVPNSTPVIVSLRECLQTAEFNAYPSKLTFSLGKDVAGAFKYADLTRMPHLLVAGSTNSGKSICLNVLIASMLYRATPAELKFLMIDPKRVELSLWDGIPHLMHPVVTDVKQAPGIFRAAIKEMERRYDTFARMQTRNLEGYNQRVAVEDRLPYIVLVVDELADLMMQAGAEIETSICRLAQLARATGIHLVIATQRPSVDVITGLIKNNIPSRIAFAVSSQVDSRTILDMSGAERLIGRGDMLFMPIDASKPMRVQGAYLSEQETNTLVSYLKEQDAPKYSIGPLEVGDSSYGGSSSGDDSSDDDLFESAVKLVVNNGHASTSMLQRRFKIGYTRAARIVDMMQERGIVGPPDGARPREILITRDQADQMFRTGPYGIPEDLLP